MKKLNLTTIGKLNRRRINSLKMFVLATFVLAATFSAQAATLTVTKTADTNDGVCDADCSLREAIAAANAGDVIEFATPLFNTAQTIDINGELFIDKLLTITGRGANLLTVRNVAANSRVFLINWGVTVNLSGMRITGGNINDSGGGIVNEGGSLTLISSTISINSAQGSGGGVVNSNATTTATNTIISGNTASNLPDFSGALTTNTNSLVGDFQNVRLAPLGFYGGTTMTHALLSGSTAINAGTATGAPATDQRGAARVGAVDIGAFELNNSANGGNFKAVLPNGTQFFSYESVLVPDNGEFTYTVTAGNLPGGIDLTTNFAPDAVIGLSGTPSESGIFNFSITATDGANSNTTDFTMEVFGPTSAQVEIAGRVLTQAGSGIRNARISMTAQDGSIRHTMTNMFGYYRFTNVEVGETYILTVVSKQYIFAPQVVSVTENVSGLNFIALAEN